MTKNTRECWQELRDLADSAGTMSDEEVLGYYSRCYENLSNVSRTLVVAQRDRDLLVDRERTLKRIMGEGNENGSMTLQQWREMYTRLAIITHLGDPARVHSLVVAGGYEGIEKNVRRWREGRDHALLAARKGLADLSDVYVRLCKVMLLPVGNYEQTYSRASVLGAMLTMIVSAAGVLKVEGVLKFPDPVPEIKEPDVGAEFAAGTKKAGDQIKDA